MSQPMSYSSALSGTSKTTTNAAPSAPQPPSFRKVPTSQNASNNASNHKLKPGQPHHQPTSTRPPQHTPQHSRQAQPSHPPTTTHIPSPSNTGAYTAEQYQRPSAHKPRTDLGEDEEHFILTLQLTAPLQTFLTSLRTTHFPKHLNKLGAHISLFRALPGSHLPHIRSIIQQICARNAPFEVAAGDAFRLKKGVAVKLGLGGGKAKGVHKALLQQFQQDGEAQQAGEKGWLSEQDAGGFQPHVTVMNKVDDEDVVVKALEEVKMSLDEFERKCREKHERHEVIGLGLWKYHKGYWQWREGFEFGQS